VAHDQEYIAPAGTCGNCQQGRLCQVLDEGDDATRRTPSARAGAWSPIKLSCSRSMLVYCVEMIGKGFI
jgi:hypothetical protein